MKKTECRSKYIATRVEKCARDYFITMTAIRKKKPYKKGKNGEMVKSPISMDDKKGTLLRVCQNYYIDYNYMLNLLRVEQNMDFNEFLLK